MYTVSIEECVEEVIRAGTRCAQRARGDVCNGLEDRSKCTMWVACGVYGDTKVVWCGARLW